MQGFPHRCGDSPPGFSASGCAPMSAYLRSGWVKAGLGLLILGSGPLLFIVVAAAVGLWPDPNPNPVGPGLLCFLTFWPAVFCVLIGVSRVRRAGR